MTHRPSPAYGPAPGISRATAFRTDVIFRVALAVLSVAFAALTLQRALHADLLGDPLPTVFMLALLLASTYAVARAWTTRVWVETSYPTGWVSGTSPDLGRKATIAELLADMPTSRTLFVIESASLAGVRRREAPLTYPTTIKLSGASFARARPSWCLSVTVPARTDQPATTLTVRAPWLTDLQPLLLRLRYFVGKDERLAADSDTLALISGRRALNQPR